MLKKNLKGFTIVEMLVAVALFSMVMLMAIASMISMIDANTKARSVKAAMDNLSFLSDVMARDIRLGSRYSCGGGSITITKKGVGQGLGQDCQYSGSNSGDVGIGLEDRYGFAMFYRFIADTTNGGCIVRRVTTQDLSLNGFTDSGAGSCNSPSSGYQRVTPKDVNITRARFYVYNAASPISGGSAGQPNVIIAMKGVAGVKTTVQTTFSIMTSATQRIPHNVE